MDDCLKPGDIIKLTRTLKTFVDSEMVIEIAAGSMALVVSIPHWYGEAAHSLILIDDRLKIVADWWLRENCEVVS